MYVVVLNYVASICRSFVTQVESLYNESTNICQDVADLVRPSAKMTNPQQSESNWWAQRIAYYHVAILFFVFCPPVIRQLLELNKVNGEHFPFLMSFNKSAFSRLCEYSFTMYVHFFFAFL